MRGLPELTLPPPRCGGQLSRAGAGGGRPRRQLDGGGPGAAWGGGTAAGLRGEEAGLRGEEAAARREEAAAAVELAGVGRRRRWEGGRARDNN